MARSAQANRFRDAVLAKVGKVQPNLLPDGPLTYDDFLAEFPPTTEGRQAAARAAGYKRGSTAYKSFLRRLQRRETTAGQRRRRPAALDAKEAGLVRKIWRTRATPSSWREVLEMMLAHGATVHSFDGIFAYEPGRRRHITTVVYVHPEVLERFSFGTAIGPPVDWARSAATFLNAWSHAYGLDENFDEADREDYDGEAFYDDAAPDSFDFSIGRGEGVQIDYL